MSGSRLEEARRFSEEGSFQSHACAYHSRMSESGVALPNDLALCHEIIHQQAETIAESPRRIDQLEHQVEQLLRRQYGPRREHVDPGQLRLFTDDAEDVEDAPADPSGTEAAPPARRWKRRGRQRLP